MNVIEAAKILQSGKKVRDPMGFVLRPVDFYTNEIVHKDGSKAEIFLSDLLSDKWSVVDE